MRMQLSIHRRGECRFACQIKLLKDSAAGYSSSLASSILPSPPFALIPAAAPLLSRELLRTGVFLVVAEAIDAPEWTWRISGLPSSSSSSAWTDDARVLLL